MTSVADYSWWLITVSCRFTDANPFRDFDSIRFRNCSSSLCFCFNPRAKIHPLIPFRLRNPNSFPDFDSTLEYTFIIWFQFKFQFQFNLQIQIGSLVLIHLRNTNSFADSVWTQEYKDTLWYRISWLSRLTPSGIINGCRLRVGIAIPDCRFIERSWLILILWNQSSEAR
jgi:hypothetical protein